MRYISALALIIIGYNSIAQTDQAYYDRNHTHHGWSYSGLEGPSHWADIDPGYSACSGEYQSPIDIDTKTSRNSDEKIEFHYHPFYVDLINNGHTLIEKIVEPKALHFKGVDYTLLQFHFHTPSEHHIDGKEFDMEIHFVHQSAEGFYAVVAILIEEGTHTNPFLAHFMNSLPTHVNEEIKTWEQADPAESLPVHPNKFYHYSGSLTTPPCTEGINWIVMEEPVEATEEQIEAIHQIIHDDNRPIQEVNERIVYHCGY